MKAFIVRPFGTQKGIDFDRVEEELIRPALAALKISGRTTGEFIQQANIRNDMFERLLIFGNVFTFILTIVINFFRVQFFFVTKLLT